MSSKQTWEVLDQVRAFRSTLREVYHKLGGESKCERVRMLLEYMERQEARLESSLSEYEKIAGQGVLRTWFQFVPELGLSPGRIDCITPDMEIAEIAQIGIELDRGIRRLYRCMAENAVSAEVKELFEGLLTHEDREEALLARTAQELELI